VPLVKGTTYENVWFSFVLDSYRDILNTEFKGTKIYISPIINKLDNFQIKIWGSMAETVDFAQDSWNKQYTTDINIYFINKNPSEQFYDQFYGDIEKAYQVLSNNISISKTVGSTTLGIIAGQVEEITINEFDAIEEEIDGLNVAKFSHTCFVERSQ